jgi:transposase-like protein
MPRTRPPYPAELFREQMVDLHRAGRTIGELSRKFGVSKQSISTWIAQSVADRGKPVRTMQMVPTPFHSGRRLRERRDRTLQILVPAYRIYVYPRIGR